MTDIHWKKIKVKIIFTSEDLCDHKEKIKFKTKGGNITEHNIYIYYAPNCKIAIKLEIEHFYFEIH